MASGSQPLGSIDWNDPQFANPDSPSPDPALTNFQKTGDAGLTGNSLSDFGFRLLHGVPSPEEVAAAKAQASQDIVQAGGTKAQADASAAALQAQIDKAAADNPTNVDNLKAPALLGLGAAALIAILILIVLAVHEVKTF